MSIVPEAGANPSRLRILVADDSATDRLIMETLLKRLGHEVLMVKNGREAVQGFQSWHPDMVLLDVMMPELDGMAAARQMRELSRHELVPIIFLTSLQDASDLASCLEAGGDDFLSKPYNPVILQAKIKAFSRLRGLHTEVKLQREYLIAEQQAAKSVFDNVVNQGALDATNIRYLMSPMVIFNGDVLLAAHQPGSDLLVLLGDFTGHGLSAAIGIMPLAEIFYGMVAKSFGLEDILREINTRLKSVLPTSVFCCATALQMNYRQRYIELWAGGLPSGLIRHGSGAITTIPSTHLPLGVLRPDDFRYQPMMVEMHADDAVYLWSDGIIEASNPAGEMFGSERLASLFRQQPADMFLHITQSLRDFTSADTTQQSGQSDDYSLVEIRPRTDLNLPGNMSTLAGTHTHDPAHYQGKSRSVGHWSLQYELSAESLKASDPVPLLMYMLMQAPGLRAHGTVINTILSELYANALEHGVLELASALKQDAEGFRRYYQLRAERLQALTDASVCIRAELLPTSGGGLLRFIVKDSGRGFMFNAQVTEGQNPSYYGRGLSLLASLCRRVEYFPPGNEVLVEFAWQEHEG